MDGSFKKEQGESDSGIDPAKPAGNRRQIALRIVVITSAAVVIAAVALALAGGLGGSSLLIAAPAPTEKSAAPLPEPATTPLPEAPSAWPTPSPGGTEEIKRPDEVVLRLDQTAVIEPGIRARIDQLKPVEGEARGPGEIAGEALRFALTLENTGNAPVSLLGSAVNAYFGAEQTPAVELSGPDRIGMPDSLAAKTKSTSHLIFAVPYSQQNKVNITLDLLATSPIVVFEGAVPQD